MKSIKTNILLTFCITAAVIILAMAVLISLKLGASIRTQSQILSKELTTMSNTTLTGYHGVFKSTIETIMEDIMDYTAQVARSPILVEMIGPRATVQITGTLDEFRVQTDKIDFILLFDLEGKYIASVPSEVYNGVDSKWLETYYQSSELWQKVNRVLKAMQSYLEADENTLQAVAKLDADFIKAFQLTNPRFAGKDFLGMHAARVVKDRLKEPIGILIGGKILNNYQKPLKQFYETTGLASAVYINDTPIVQEGFSGQDKEAATAQSLQLPPEILNEIFATDKPKNLSLTLAGKKYRSACSAIVDAKGEKIGALMVAMPEQVITEIDQRVSRYGTTEKRKLQLWLLGFGLAALAALVVISKIIADRVAQPVLSVVTLANAIASGDLTQRLNMDREDEIGHMATALDNSCKNLSGMIARIKGNADMLASAAEEMSTVSAQMASSAEEMSAQSGTVAGATEQMSANINSMASAAEEMSVNIQSVSSTAEEMSQNMDAVASAIEEMSVSIKDVAANAQAGSNTAAKAAAMTTSATETMADLSTAAREIDKVTSLIKRIADQTNLLALNATIEAASAGDAGKGFAVVANEIKELARQSAQAAEDIAKRIEGVQVNSKQAAKAIGKIADIITQVNESSLVITKSVEQQTITANEISGNVQQASSGVNNIASAIAEIARGANDVSQSTAEAAKGVTEVSANTQGVSQAANDSNSGAQQVSASAGELAKMAVEIQSMVDRFKIEKK
ncbi:MAG: methyl-accepting chemotaxis protein [Desulfobacterales bacterium]|nr:methyl-accepting chemotaxis protein [Desulfobacterales bacterium]